MEIIHVVLGKANPERMNGVNKVVHQLATQQVTAGRKVTVWGITRDTTANYPPRNFDTILFRTSAGKFTLNPEISVAIAANAGKQVVYHLHGGFNPEMYSVAKELRKQQQKYVFTPHGAYNTIAMRKSYLQKKIYFRLFEKKMLKGAAAIHSLGESEVNGLQQIFPNNKSVQVPYGFTAPGITKTGNTPEPFIIGYCGRIDIYTKGLDLLLHAFARVSKKMPGAQLWIIGGGKEEPALKKMISRLNIEKEVRLFGALFGEEKDEIMRRFTVFAHPSRNEGLPTAVLEAAGMGIPCIVTAATNTAAVIEQYQAGATITTPGKNELFEAIMHLSAKLSGNGYANMSQNARRMVAEAFNWKEIVHRFDNLYQHP